MGYGHEPGGLQHDPPKAVGIGEWDYVGGFAGQGGMGHLSETNPGNAGAVRVMKPGNW
jgi:hypothetical protein